MLKTTSQQLIDSLGYEGGRVGQPQKFGAAIDQTSIGVAATAGDVITVPQGNVFLMTHLVLQIDQSGEVAGTKISSPTGAMSYNGFQLRDADMEIKSSITFRGFSRYRTIFTQGGGSPDFRAAQPGEVITWRPKYPIPVPSGWTLDMPTSGIGWGNQSAVYGVMVSESASRQLGYQVSSVATPSTDRNYGLAGTAGTTSATDVVAARTGKSIHVLDVHVRAQPETTTANTLTLQQADGTKIYKVVNDNPAELVDQSFSPGWYLKAGQALQCISDVADYCSVNVSYEYVDEDDIPGDYFFAVVEPNSPTPGAGTAGNILNLFFDTIAVTSTEATLYYPKGFKDAAGTTVYTQTSPNKGFQHMLNGYSVFCQKQPTTANATDDTEQTRFTISTGASAGRVELSYGDITQANLQLSPVFSASGHDQCTYGLVEGVNIPCKKDDGSIWIDAMGFNALAVTPTSADADIRDWAVNLWGRTAPATFSPRTNEGT